jgi:hypothetical protein
MPGTLLRRCATIAAAVAVAAAPGGMAAAASVPAQAVPYGTGCVWELGHQFYTDPPEIYAYDVLYCPTHTYDYPVSILKLENGTWVDVASGSGSTTYVCHGTTENEYQTSFNGVDFDEACG